MHRLSDTMTDGVVAKWHKKEGDKIQEGDLLADIETDKATMEFESFQEGFLLYIGVKESESAPVDSILAVLGEKGEDISELLNQKDSQKSDDVNKQEKEPKSIKTNNIEEAPFVEDQQRLKITPLARKIS